eukprot:m.249452 g.249452  ORF g.249452 m.249452 type:complete len:392 (+) comp15879_c0_seq5:212-1387(+)
MGRRLRILGLIGCRLLLPYRDYGGVARRVRGYVTPAHLYALTSEIEHVECTHVGHVDPKIERACPATLTARFDLLVLQEVRDSSGNAMQLLLSRLNANASTPRYEAVVSPRFGRVNSSYREAVAWLYRPTKVQPGAQQDWANATRGQYGYTTDRTGRLFPARSPHAVEWTILDPATGVAASGVPKLVTVGFHADPDDVVPELHAVGQVTAGLFASGDDVLVLGDLNADCSYLSASERACATNPSCTATEISLLEPATWTWLVNDSADTTVGATDCAYDRIVLGSNATARPASATAHVVRDPAIVASVSDHFPVAITLEYTTASGGTFAPTSPPTPLTSPGGPSATSDESTDTTTTVVIPVAVGAAALLLGGLVFTMYKRGTSIATNPTYVA